MLVYKCRAIGSDFEKSKISEILSGKIRYAPEITDYRAEQDAQGNLKAVIVRTPIGEKIITSECRWDTNGDIQIPGILNITMPAGCLWHSSPDKFEDKLDANPGLDFRVSESQLEKLIRPESLQFRHLLTPELLEEVSIAACTGIIGNTRTVGVCSLSKSFCNIELWDKYAENGNGIALEYEVSGSSSDGFYHVTYSDEPAILSLDQAIECHVGDKSGSALDDVVNNLLCKKTTCWGFEDEIRHVATGANQYSYFAEIKRILLGYRIDKSLVSWLNSEHPEYKCVETRVCDNKVIAN